MTDIVAKIFTSSNLTGLEAQINQWLKNHPEMSFSDMKILQSESAAQKDTNASGIKKSLTITIFSYKD